MFSIGEFSRLCMVTTKTLRHYDSIGLLKPAQQNEETGYRYYDVSQLNDMLLILKLKDYGFSLEEISGLLGAEQSQVMYMLVKKLGEQTQQAKQQNALLKRIKQDIKLLEKGKDIMENKLEVKLVERKPMDVLSVREMIAVADFDKLFGKLYAKMQQEQMQPTGAPMAFYHSEDFNPQNSDVEVAFPTNAKEGVTRTLDGGKYATILHKGTYSTLNQSYAFIAKWIEQNGYKIANSPFEIYLNDPSDTKEDDLRTEIYFPIA